MSESDSSHVTPQVRNDFEHLGPRGRPLHQKILIGLIVGILAGMVANIAGGVPQQPQDSAPSVVDQDRNRIHDRLDLLISITEPIGKVFLRLILMVVVPLVCSALILGVYEIGDVRKLGRIGLKTLGLTLIFSFSAVVIGILLVNGLQPAGGLSEQQRADLQAQYAGGAGSAVQKAQEAKPLSVLLLDIIPENPLQEMVGAVDGSSKGNGMLSVMFFAVIIGIALTVVGARGQTLVKTLEGVFDVTMVVIGFAMRLAPYAVACLVFGVVARLGFDILQTLLWFVLTVAIGLALHMFVVYSLVLKFVGGVSPLAFFRAVPEAMLTAFGTSSSNATLPTALRVAKEELKIQPRIAQFVLTVGATGNQNGTALYEGVVVLFLAQVFGVELTVMQQVTVVLMSVLAGIGTAGVPGGSLPLIVILLRTIGVPGEGIGLILGVDRLLDMGRTVLNVTGDLAIAACVAKLEGGESYPMAPESEGSGV